MSATPAPQWTVVNNTGETLSLPIKAGSDDAVTVIAPCTSSSDSSSCTRVGVAYQSPLLPFPAGSGFTFLKVSDVLTINQTWRGQLPSGKPYVAVSYANTAVQDPSMAKIHTTFTSDPGGPRSAAQIKSTARKTFIIVTSVLGACLVAAVIVAIVVICVTMRARTRVKVSMPAPMPVPMPAPMPVPKLMTAPTQPASFVPAPA